MIVCLYLSKHEKVTVRVHLLVVHGRKRKHQNTHAHSPQRERENTKKYRKSNTSYSDCLYRLSVKTKVKYPYVNDLIRLVPRSFSFLLVSIAIVFKRSKYSSYLILTKNSSTRLQRRRNATLLHFYCI